MSANLTLHCGAFRVEREKLNDVQLPPSTRTYCPVSHAQLADLIQERVVTLGYTIKTEAHALSIRDQGARYFGLYELDAGTDDYGLVLGFRNSHNKRIPAGVAFGSVVFVCDNLAFIGEVRFDRKHTPNVLTDLPALIDTGLSKLLRVRRVLELQYEAMKNTPLSAFEADHLILEMYRRGIIGPNRIGPVVSEWENPSYREFGDVTAWRLFNAVTHVLKGSSVLTSDMTSGESGVVQKTVDLHRLFVRHMKLDVGSPAL